jgi:hypothetical protein
MRSECFYDGWCIMKQPHDTSKRLNPLLKQAGWPCAVAGWGVMAGGLAWRNYWLLDLAFALTLAGCRLIPFLARRRVGSGQDAGRAGRPRTDEEQAEEDAAVAAFERYMEAEARFRVMGSHRDGPPQRLH